MDFFALNDPLSVLNEIVCALEKDASKVYSIELDRNKILKLAEKRSNYLISRGNRIHEK